MAKARTSIRTTALGFSSARDSQTLSNSATFGMIAAKSRTSRPPESARAEHLEQHRAWTWRRSQRLLGQRRTGRRRGARCAHRLSSGRVAGQTSLAQRNPVFPVGLSGWLPIRAEVR